MADIAVIDPQVSAMGKSAVDESVGHDAGDFIPNWWDQIGRGGKRFDRCNRANGDEDNHRFSIAPGARFDLALFLEQAYLLRVSQRVRPSELHEPLSSQRSSFHHCGRCFALLRISRGCVRPLNLPPTARP